MTDRSGERSAERSVQFNVGDNIYGKVVDLSSAEYAEFRRFQEDRFARLQSTRADSVPELGPKYTPQYSPDDNVRQHSWETWGGWSRRSV